jgi:phosphoribosylcarboxyaminoimidazole (NCAIR) mutase
MIKTDRSDGVTVISGSEIDADTRARIEEVLKDAGADGDVMFIDGSEMKDDMQAHEKREVRIIKKEINETN